MNLQLADVNKAFEYFGEFVLASTVLCHSLRGVVKVLEKVSEWTFWKFDDTVVNVLMKGVDKLCTALEGLSKVAGVGALGKRK